MNEASIIATYSSSHQNPTNQLIHLVCVPVIFFNVVALMYALLPVTLVAAFVAGSMIFYVKSLRSFVPHMILLYGLVLGVCAFFAGSRFFVTVNMVLFVVAWVGQFWGHRIEGKKPSFFQDVFFLLVGPAWVMEKLRQKFLKGSA